MELSMASVADICDFLEAIAPSELAAEWDNVGLLVGDRGQPVERLLTCLTITPAVAAEAVRERVQLIVTHHPLPFRPLKRLTADEPAGRILLDLIRAGIAIHSPHTAFDSAAAGINQQLAEGLGLLEIRPLIDNDPDSSSGVGTGRYGRLQQSQSLLQVSARLKQFLNIPGLQRVGDPQQQIEQVAIGCGSAGEFLADAVRLGCQLLVTGETRLHTCYDAEARGLALLLCGHYASERFGVERLAQVLANQFQQLAVWPSHDERDPLTWI
jgi:dinuclear metal center YbgI/SA1388 family protein